MAFSATEALADHIRSLGYSAFTLVPKDKPEKFVTVERTGGGPRSLVDHPYMAVQAWAKSEDGAEALANELRLSLLTGKPPDGIHSIRCDSGPYRFYDEATGLPRYQMTLSVTSRI